MMSDLFDHYIQNFGFFAVHCVLLLWLYGAWKSANADAARLDRETTDVNAFSASSNELDAFMHTVKVDHEE